VAFALSASASIRRILTSGNHKSAATRFRCFLIPRRKSFGVTMCCIAERGRKERILRDRPSFCLIPTGSFAGSISRTILPCAHARNRFCRLLSNWSTLQTLETTRPLTTDGLTSQLRRAACSVPANIVECHREKARKRSRETWQSGRNPHKPYSDRANALVTWFIVRCRVVLVAIDAASPNQ